VAFLEEVAGMVLETLAGCVRGVMGEFQEGTGVSAIYFGDGVNWRATSHQQIYDWFAQAPPEGMRVFGGGVDGQDRRALSGCRRQGERGVAGVRGLHWEGSLRPRRCDWARRRGRACVVAKGIRLSWPARPPSAG